MLSRRDLVGKLAVGAAGVAGLAISTARAGASVGRQAVPGAPARSDYPEAEPRSNAAVDAPERLVNAVEDGTAIAPSEAVAPPPPPWELLEPLAAGSILAHGWRVADLSSPTAGACVLTLENERGRVQRIHLCRNGGTPLGLVYTQRVDLVVMNGGRGDLGTEEHLAQAVADVAHAIAANEDRWAQRAVIDALLPHAERLQQFAAANEWTLR